MSTERCPDAIYLDELYEFLCRRHYKEYPEDPNASMMDRLASLAAFSEATIPMDLRISCPRFDMDIPLGEEDIITPEAPGSCMLSPEEACPIATRVQAYRETQGGIPHDIPQEEPPTV